jgi:glycosyltransferase involved in cell wall biosynthesis
MKNLILISAYNGESTLSDVLLELKAFPELDILVIDDGSTDKTAEIARNAGVNVISHDKNKGKGAALRTGMNFALRHNAETVITMDADKQHPAGKIRDFLDLHALYPDAVILGKRERDKNMPCTRKFSNSVSAALISWRIAHKIYDAQCGFRLIPGKYLHWHFSNINGFIFESEVLITLALNGVDFKFVPIQTIYPQSGQTKMTYFDSTIGFIFMYISSFFKSYKQDDHDIQ